MMAYNPRMGLKSFQLGDLCLGMNELSDPYELRAGEAATLKNVVPGGRGTYLKVRKGTLRLNSFGASPVTSILYWRVRNTTVIGALNNNIKSCGQFNGAVTTQFTSANPSTGPERWCFEIAKDGSGNEMLWGVNGVDVPQKWNGIAATTSAWTNPPPTKCRFIRLWKNRIIAGGDPTHPDRLYYSEIGNPEVGSAAAAAVWNFIDIRSSYDDSDTLTWCELSGENLIVFRPNSTWLIYDSNTFANRRLGGPGAIHQFMSAELEGIVYFAAEDGLYFTNGAQEPQLADPKVDLSNYAVFGGITDGWFSTLIADPVEQCLYYAQYSGSASPNLWIYYPPRTKSNPRKEGVWFRQQLAQFQKTTALYCVNALGADHVLGGNDSGRLMDYFVGFNDDSTTGASDDGIRFSWLWETGWIRLVDFEAIERIRRLNMRVKGDITVFVATRDSNFTSAFSNGQLLFSRIRPELRGREFQITFSGQTPTLPGAVSFELHDLELVYRGSREHTMKDST